MGAVFENLSIEELCDLMCGAPEEEWEEEVVKLEEAAEVHGHKAQQSKRPLRE